MNFYNTYKEFSSYMSKAIHLYAEEAVQRQQNCYRIVEESTESNPCIYFQIIGKNVILKMLPEELMRSKYLMGFSKADISIITYLGARKEFENLQKPKLMTRIIRQLFHTSGKIKFLLKLPDQEELVEALPEEIMTNNSALNTLPGEDAAKIGFAAAENRYREIKKETSSDITCKILYQDFLNQQLTYLDCERNSEHTAQLMDIFYNKNLLNLFNKIDQQMISFASGEAYQKGLPNNKQYRFKLRAYLGEVIEYQDVNGNIAKESLLDLAFDKELLAEFNLEERDIILFIAGELSEKRKHDEIKKN